MARRKTDEANESHRSNPVKSVNERKDKKQEESRIRSIRTDQGTNGDERKISFE